MSFLNKEPALVNAVEKGIPSTLAEIEESIFKRAYRELDDEVFLASGLNKPVNIEAIEVLEVNSFHDRHIEIITEVTLEFEAGYGICADVALYITDFEQSPLKIEMEEIEHVIENNFNNIYCDEALAFTTDEQAQAFSQGNTQDKWVLYLTKKHNSDDLGLAVLRNLKNEDSPYGSEILKQFKERFTTLVINAVANHEF